ncbi:unnamed protein product [Mytilus coruscus]|uniref:B box-type domain-containing protein n=1 Tax=Mytilus coruscus TaxID=42192 RepID=A0A6J8BQ31_MYTCO|nr:unnamed protein product [Mytilus coruscus]
MEGSQSVVVENSTQHVFCSLHSKETTFLCKVCRQFICDQCVESVHGRHALKAIPRTNNVILSNEILEQHIQIYKEVWKVQLEEQLDAMDLHAAKLVEIINKKIEEESDNNNPPTLSLIQTTFTPSKIDFLRIKRQFGELSAVEKNVSLQLGLLNGLPRLHTVKHLATENFQGFVYQGMSSDIEDEYDYCDV